VELNGRVAVVTGGAVRLGRAISLALAEAGTSVVLHYGRSAAAAEETCRDIEALGARAAKVQSDLRHPVEAAEQIFAAVQAAFGRADILVNSAAIFEAGTLPTTTEDQWDQHFNINLKAPFFLCRQFQQQLTASRAHIVNIADWRAGQPTLGHLAYSLTKAGIVALTRQLALELAPRVQVNAIAPGAILPPPGAGPEYLRRVAEQIPLQRAGTPKDITDTLLFLLRSEFVTGEVVHVTGGEQF
jgi:NAD(P)-dependent dehydrogenase (short-subunit alcohol dehydrogenase family)